MCSSPVTSGVAAVSVDLCLAAVSARIACNRSFHEADVQSSDQVNSTIQKNTTDWAGIDRTWDCEDSIMRSVTGKQSETRLLAALLQCMPSRDEAMEASDSMQHIGNLISSPVYKYAAIGVQGKLVSLQAALGRIVDGRAPDIGELLKDTPVTKWIEICIYIVCSGG